MKRIEHQVGEKRGRLTYQAEVIPGAKSHGQAKRRGRFLCDCGNATETTLSSWRSGKTASCGCLHKERQAEAPATHGQSKSALYSCWTMMRVRCLPAYGTEHPTYAGVGCDPRWETFEGFRDNQPAGRPFEPGLVLARTGDVGNYEPGNCRWTTPSDNGREAAERRMLRLPDGRFALDVARLNGINSSTFGSRLNLGWDLTDAATRPTRRLRRAVRK